MRLREARGETGPGSAALAGLHGHYTCYTTGVFIKWIIALFRWSSGAGGGWQKMLRITAKLGPHSIAQEGDRQDVLIALFIFGSKTQITLGGGAVSEAQMALSFYLNRIEWQNKVFFNLNNVWNASPAIEGSIREFWLDAEIKIGKELNYLGTIILMICPQSLIAFIQLDRAPPYKQLHIPDTLRLNPFLPLQQNEVVSEASWARADWLADTDSCLEPEVAWLMSIMMVTFYPLLDWTQINPHNASF